MKHLTSSGWLPCGVTVGRCPYMDHATNAEVEAMMLEEHGLGSTAVTSEPMDYISGVRSIREQLVARVDYPAEVMSDLATIAEHHRSVAITPAGSQLYNTMLPGKVHDYDFVLLTEPGNKSPIQIILNEVVPAVA